MSVVSHSMGKAEYIGLLCVANEKITWKAYDGYVSTCSRFFQQPFSFVAYGKKSICFA